MYSFVQDLVINIGDVADEGYVVTSCGQPATQNIKVNSATNMANMWRRLNGCTTEIDSNLVSFQRFEICDLAGRCVVQA